jgi:diguanylate cyclase (GGDEF)-like protein
MKKNKRITIGMIVSVGFDTENYDSMLWPGATEFAEEHDINLILFVNRQNPEDVRRFKSNISHEFVTPKTVDGLIIPTGTMSDVLTPAQLRRFCDRFKPLPIVSIAMAIRGVPSVLVDNTFGIKEVTRHLIVEHDYRKIAFISGPRHNQDAAERLSAYREILVDYKIPYNPDLVVEGKFTAESGKEAARLLFEKRKQRVQAIVASDDESAFGALSYLKSKGYRVPYDVAVTGFDDVERAASVSPPLTTVRQPVYEQSKKACEMLLDIIRGKTVPGRVCLPTRMVLRQSCGCFSDVIKEIKTIAITTRPLHDAHEKKMYAAAPAIARAVAEAVRSRFRGVPVDPALLSSRVQTLLRAFLDDLFGKTKPDYFLWFFYNFITDLIDHEQDISVWNHALIFLQKETLALLEEKDTVFKTQSLFQKAALIYDEIVILNKSYISLQKEQRMLLLLHISHSLINTFNLENLKTVIARELPKLKIRRCYLSLFRENASRRAGELGWLLPEHSELLFANTENGLSRLSAPKTTFTTTSLLPSALFPATSRYTFILMAISYNDEQFGFILYEYGPSEDIIYETIRGQVSSVIKASSILKNLECKNIELQELSLNDQLTGLYNRRGFSLLGEQQMRIHLRKKNGVLLFFLDLDKLKEINDTFGHKEGDEAIANFAKVLQRTFRDQDIIARIGGDEFTVLTIDANPQCKNSIIKRLNKNIAAFNATSRKPYRLSVSYGYASVDSINDASLDWLIAQADAMLYTNKSARRSQNDFGVGRSAL